jgi:hypothetical protein
MWHILLLLIYISAAIVMVQERTMAAALNKTNFRIFINFSFWHNRVKRLYDFPSADDSQQDNHYGNYQKEVNEPAQGIGGNEPQDPQYDQNSGNSVKHDYRPFII